MKNRAALENIVFSVGGLIFITLIFSGWKGMLAAAAVFGWLVIMAYMEKRHGAQQAAEEEEALGRVYRFENRSRARRSRRAS